MYSYNEVELRTRNITACDQEMITFSGESKKYIVKGCSISIHMSCDWKAFKSSESNANDKKKKVSYRIWELETTKKQAVAGAPLPWGTIAWQINANFFYSLKSVSMRLGISGYVCKNKSQAFKIPTRTEVDNIDVLICMWCPIQTMPDAPQM